jgi:hypothetical protein
VDLIEGGTSVGRTNAGWTNVGGRKVTVSFALLTKIEANGIKVSGLKHYLKS